VPSKTQAEAVLNKCANNLRKAGAHAVHVDPGKGKADAKIVAWVEKDDHQVPESVTEKVAGKSVTIPVVTKRQERFKLE
jgi:hypothetical protein